MSNKPRDGQQANTASELNELESWNIHNTKYTVKAQLRELLFKNVAPGNVVYVPYSDDSDTGGYKGWHELKGFGVLAYKREDDTLQFDW